MEPENKVKLIIAIVLFLVIALATFDSMAQSQAVEFAKVQKSVEWENYQKTWMKKELEAAKEVRKINKEREKEAKQRQKFFARIERIKE